MGIYGNQQRTRMELRKIRLGRMIRNRSGKRDYRRRKMRMKAIDRTPRANSPMCQLHLNQLPDLFAYESLTSFPRFLSLCQLIYFWFLSIDFFQIAMFHFYSNVQKIPTHGKKIIVQNEIVVVEIRFNHLWQISHNSNGLNNLEFYFSFVWKYLE